MLPAPSERRAGSRVVSLIALCFGVGLACQSRGGDDAAKGTLAPEKIDSDEGSTQMVMTANPRAAEPASKNAPRIEKRYEVEQGVIEYALDGMQVGKETMRFKNYGLFEIKETESKLTMPAGLKLPTQAQPQTERTVTIIDGTTTTTYDVDKKTGTRLLNTLELLGGERRLAGKNMSQVGLQLIEAMGGVKTGTRTVAGQSCDVWKMDRLSTESCVHKGVTLEVTVTLVGMKQHSVATKIDFAAEVDDEIFKVPDDVELEVTDLSKQNPMGTPKSIGEAKTLTPQEALDAIRNSAPKPE